MSSPSSPAPSHAGTKKHTEQVTFKFCPECSNMLYPKEDKDARRLMYTCRTCQHSEEATSNCIYRNTLRNTVGETAGVTQDVASDPTVSRDSPANGPSNTPSPPSALVLCGCCGQVIMCSDCGLRPAAAVSESDDCEAEPSTPPETYQEEILEQMIVDEDALNRMLKNIVDMTDIMDLDEDMDDWEPDPEEANPSHGVQTSVENSVAA
jgi:DNA-directed RNA polymerase subunit M/transcription elongation factor TFIIS